MGIPGLCDYGASQVSRRETLEWDFGFGRKVQWLRASLPLTVTGPSPSRISHCNLACTVGLYSC